MITVRKLATLPGTTGLRKTARLLQGFETDINSGVSSPNPIYLRDLFDYIKKSPELAADKLVLIDQIVKDYNNQNESLLRTCNRIRHILLTHLNEAPADWDLLPGISNLENIEQIRDILPFEVFLDDIRSPFNVGSIFRTSDSFGVSKILISPGTASPQHRRAQRTAMGCTETVPWEISECIQKKDQKVFALELNGTPLNQFKFPDKGIVIIGSEELGVSPECMATADSSMGRVSIPMAGTKGSINVSVAFGILMYCWYNSIVNM